MKRHETLSECQRLSRRQSHVPTRPHAGELARQSPRKEYPINSRRNSPVSTHSTLARHGQAGAEDAHAFSFSRRCVSHCSFRAKPFPPMWWSRKKSKPGASKDVAAQHSGHLVPHSAATVCPHCGTPVPTSVGPGHPRGGVTAINRPNTAFGALQETWLTVAKALPEHLQRNAKELAVAFFRSLQAQSDLTGQRIDSWSIRKSYPVFCRSLGMAAPPPYKDFATELAPLMPRRRKEVWRDGKRVGTQTGYLLRCRGDCRLMADGGSCGSARGACRAARDAVLRMDFRRRHRRTGAVERATGEVAG
jgi:hypothetical protein